MHLSEYKEATSIRTVFKFVTALLIPILGPYIKNMGFSYVEMGFLFSLTPLLPIFYTPIAGRLSDILGRKLILSAGFISEIIAIIFYVIGDGNTYLIGAARIFSAVAAATVAMMTLCIIEDNVNRDSRGKFTGISLSLGYVGKLLGPVAGGFLADYFFVKAPFVVAGLVLFLLLLFSITRIKNRVSIESSDISWRKPIKEFISHRRLKGMAVLGMVMHAMNPAIKLFLPIYIVDNLGLTFTSVGYALFALTAPDVLQFLFGKMADKKGYLVILAGTVISGIMLIALAETSVYLILLLVLFIEGLGRSMWNVSAWTLMSNIGKRIKKQGGIVGGYTSIAKMGSFISFVLSGFIVQTFGIPGLFLLSGAVVIAGSLVAYFYLKPARGVEYTN